TEQIRELTIIGGTSQLFIQTLISHPRLVKLLGNAIEPELAAMTHEAMREFFAEEIANVISNDTGFDEASTRLRRCWHEQLIKIGRNDLLTIHSKDPSQAMSVLR